MKKRELQMGVLILAICAVPLIGIELNRKLALHREQMSPAYSHKMVLRERFRTIQPQNRKVLMVPGASWNSPGNPTNTDFYTMSLAKNDYWKKPMVVDVGFKFGYFSGAKYYEYQILDIHDTGVRMRYAESALAPGELDLPWQ
jgi:hypothetical protein